MELVHLPSRWIAVGTPTRKSARTTTHCPICGGVAVKESMAKLGSDWNFRPENVPPEAKPGPESEPHYTLEDYLDDEWE